jgi:hypothetical protein
MAWQFPPGCLCLIREIKPNSNRSMSRRFMSLSKLSRQIMSQGRPYISGISTSIRFPGVIGILLPFTLKIVWTHSMYVWGVSYTSL